MKLVRYADDFVVMVAGTRDDAEALRDEVSSVPEANSRVRRGMPGEHRPALTVVITGIYDERWLLEIEARAGT